MDIAHCKFLATSWLHLSRLGQSDK